MVKLLDCLLSVRQKEVASLLTIYWNCKGREELMLREGAVPLVILAEHFTISTLLHVNGCYKYKNFSPFVSIKIMK